MTRLQGDVRRGGQHDLESQDSNSCHLQNCSSVVSHACSAFGDQKRALGPLELEFQTVVSYCVGAGNQTLGSL